eukprot:3637931-Pyramimonas_sp.AAC.1
MPAPSMACQSSGSNFTAGWPAALVMIFWVEFPMRISPFQKETSILEGCMKSRPMGRPSAGLSTTLNTTRPAWPQSASGA